MKLSIIIPVYNTANYLERCVNSCLNQNIKKDDYEIILINDGSTDNSLQLIRKTAENKINVSYYTQENRGLSETRNRGVRLAKGDYVWFVDSDDWIRENTLKDILDKCIKLDLDAFQLGACNVLESKKKRIYTVIENQVSTGLELMSLKNKFYVCVPFTIYRRQFLIDNDLYFYPRIFHEDCEFSPRSYYCAKKVSGTNQIIYYVYNNMNSITHTMNPKRAYDLLFVIKQLENFSAKFTGKERRIYSTEISINLNLLLIFANKLNGVEKEKIKKELFEQRAFYKHYFKSGKLKYMIEGILFGLFPKLVLNISNKLL